MRDFSSRTLPILPLYQHLFIRWFHTVDTHLMAYFTGQLGPVSERITFQDFDKGDMTATSNLLHLVPIYWVNFLTSHSILNRSYWRCSSQSISWLVLRKSHSHNHADIASLNFSKTIYSHWCFTNRVNTLKNKVVLYISVKYTIISS